MSADRYCWMEIAQEDQYMFSSAQKGDFIMTLTTSCNMCIGMTNGVPIMVLSNQNATVAVNGCLASGNIEISTSGSPLLPPIHWAHASNSGLCSTHPHQISIVTQGQEKFTVSPSGYVGINTTSPEYPLHVSGDVQVTGFIDSDTIKTSGRVRIEPDGTLSNIKNVHITSQFLPSAHSNPSQPPYTFSTALRTGMYLHSQDQIGFCSDGTPIAYIGSNIGIFTDTPMTGTALHVKSAPVCFEHLTSRMMVEGALDGHCMRTASNISNSKLFLGGTGGVVLQSYSNLKWSDRLIMGQNGSIQLFGNETSLAFESQDSGYRLRTIEIGKSLILNGGCNITMYPDPTNLYRVTVTPQGIRFNDGGSQTRPSIGWDTSSGTGLFSSDNQVCVTAQNNTVACFTTDTLIVNGNINATGSKNFYIDHPMLPNVKLVHAAIEAPRYDLMYRGSATLQNGKAIVSIDSRCTSNGGMTIGSFQAITRDHQVYLQNNTPDSWDLVKGSIMDGDLHIISNNPSSSATIEWLIMCERNDSTILAMNSDSKGRLRVEVPSTFTRT